MCAKTLLVKFAHCKKKLSKHLVRMPRCVMFLCFDAVEQVIAMYKYQKQNPDELSFEKGCVINVIEKLDSDWWTGELNGQTGLFPSNYVAPLSSISDSDQSSAAVTCEFISNLL